MARLSDGESAPAFSLEDQDGKLVKLSDFKGKKVIVYFYPKDDTPGCTTQACDFRDSVSSLKKAGYVVLGISKDTDTSHRKFREKYSLPFTLLTDDGNKVGVKYGAFGEKTLYGKKTVGVIRSTFVIDEKGKLARVQYNVRAKGHVAKLKADLGIK